MTNRLYKYLRIFCLAELCIPLSRKADHPPQNYSGIANIFLGFDLRQVHLSQAGGVRWQGCLVFLIYFFQPTWSDEKPTAFFWFILYELCLGRTAHFKVLIRGVLVAVDLHVGDMFLLWRRGLVDFHEALVVGNPVSASPQNDNPHDDHHKHGDAPDGDSEGGARHAITGDRLLVDILVEQSHTKH